jgi:hypothetical protein
MWTLPLACVLFVITESILDRTVSLPKMQYVGRDSVVEFQVNTPRHLFYIGRYAPIEDDYNRDLSLLDFRVLDEEGKPIRFEGVDRFFFSGTIEGRKVYAGSVFRLPKTIAYPFKGRIESNIDKLEGLMWFESNGSFALLFILFFVLLALSVGVIYFSFLRKPGSQVKTTDAQPAVPHKP